MHKKSVFFVLMCTFLLFIFTSCGSTKSDDSKLNVAKQEVEDGEAPSDVEADFDTNSKNSETNNTQNIILSQRKIIRNASLTIEVENFDKAYDKIKTIVENDGYVQDSSIQKDDSFDFGNNKNLVTTGTITLRVDQNKFDKILEDIHDIGIKISEDISSDDVTDQYYDIDSEIKLLKLEQSKLEEYLKNTDDIEMIFKLEDKLTEIRHNIESLTGNLNKLDDLVKTSTIVLTIRETEELEDEDSSYLKGLFNNFIKSMKFLGDIIIAVVTVFSYILPFIIFFTVIACIIILIVKLLRKSKNKKLMKKNMLNKGTSTKNEEDEQNDDKDNK
ncbi:MAG: DUF4349 domain-containing protein [Clostridiales bacterium]